jgi:hypothetical protein
MVSTLRIIWDDGTSRKDDYEVVNDVEAIGRIYRSNSSARLMWLWSVYGAFPGGRRNNGSADAVWGPLIMVRSYSNSVGKRTWSAFS